MQTIKARDIIQTPILQVWNIFTDKQYNVVYDNGEEELTSSKSLIFNRYIWFPFESYSATPITKDCSVQSVVSKQYFTSDVHIRLLEAVFKNICKHNHLDAFNQKDMVLKLIYKAYNLILADYVNRIASHVTTIDAIDFVETVKMPEIQAIHAGLRPSTDSVEQAYKDIKKTLNTTTNLNNMFIHAYKCKSINENQANQCIGPRGFVAGKNRTVYKQPIMSGFITGMSSLFDMAAESETAAKSLTATDKHIATSEYKSRLMQLLTMVAERVEYTDCGSTEYYDFLIPIGGLQHLKGKYHLHENTLKCIDGTETYLENTIVKLRTAIGCTLKNPHHICSTCLGEISKNFRADTNLGYVFSAYLMEKGGQNILSTKHLTHSVKSNTVHLDGEASNFFNVNIDVFFLNKGIDYTNVSITLDSKQLPKLMDVLNLSHSHIALEKIGEITNVIFTKDEHSKKSANVVNVQHGDRSCILSKEFLEYIRHINIYSDHKGNYVIPLNRFNIALPIFTMPVKESNMINFITKMASILETNYDKITDPYDKLTLLYMHVSKQFSINLTVLETLVYATTTYNSQQDDFSLGRNSVNKTTESLFNLSKGRSMSLLFATENQENAIFDSNLSVFNRKNMIDHPSDVFFDPHAVMQHIKAKRSIGH